MDDRNVIFMKDLRKAQRKAWVREKVQAAKDFMSDNKEVLVIAITSIIGLGKMVTKSINKTVNLRKEEHLKNEYCYDRSLGHYWELRRKLTNKEWLEIDRRKKNGEKLSDILKGLMVINVLILARVKRGLYFFYPRREHVL